MEEIYYLLNIFSKINVIGYHHKIGQKGNTWFLLFIEKVVFKILALLG